MNSLSFHPSDPSSPEGENPRRHTGHEKRIDVEEEEEERKEEEDSDDEVDGPVLGILEGGEDVFFLLLFSSLCLFVPTAWSGIST